VRSHTARWSVVEENDRHWSHRPPRTTYHLGWKAVHAEAAVRMRASAHGTPDHSNGTRVGRVRHCVMNYQLAVAQIARGERYEQYSTKEVPKRASLPSKAFAGATISLSALATGGTPARRAHAEASPASGRLSITISSMAALAKSPTSSEMSCTGHTDGHARPVRGACVTARATQHSSVATAALRTGERAGRPSTWQHKPILFHRQHHHRELFLITGLCTQGQRKGVADMHGKGSCRQVLVCLSCGWCTITQTLGLRARGTVFIT